MQKTLIFALMFGFSIANSCIDFGKADQTDDNLEMNSLKANSFDYDVETIKESVTIGTSIFSTLTFEKCNENLNLHVSSENAEIIKISSNSFDFSYANTNGSGQYTIVLANDDEKEVAAAYVYSDGFFDTISFSSMNDAMALHYLNNICSDEDKIILGYEEEPEDFYSTSTFYDAKNKFDAYVYGDGDIVASYEDVSNDNSSTVISGNVFWHDGDGKPHPLKNAIVYLCQKNYFSNKIISQTYTDDAGYFFFDSENFSDSASFYLCLASYTESSDIGHYEASGDVSWISYKFFNYSFQSTLIYNLNDGFKTRWTIDIYSGKSDRANAFEISQAIEITAKYVEKMNGSLLNRITVKYPCIDPTECSFSRILKEIKIGVYEYDKWDVIAHEYGHYINYSFDLCDVTVGGKHNVDEDLIESHGKADGLKLAMSEGLATYLGIASHMYFKEFYGDVHYVGDMKYSDIGIDDIDFDCYCYRVLPYFNNYGEGNEFSIPSLLLKIMDDKKREDDNVMIGHFNMWSVLKSEKHWCISSLINSLFEIFSDEKENISKLLEKEGFSPQISSESSNILPTSLNDTITLKWFDDYSINCHSNLFDLIFQGEDGETYEIKEIETTQYTLTQTDLTKILSLGGTSIEWYVTGYNDNLFLTGGYTSCCGILKKPIIQILKKDSYVVSEIDSEGIHWYEFTAPFSGTYSFNFFGNDGISVLAEAFPSIVLNDNSNAKALDASNAGDGSISLKLSKDDEIFFRIKNTENKSCQYSFNVTFDHVHKLETYTQYSKIKHKAICACGYFVLENHATSRKIISNNSFKYTNCTKCGCTINLTDTNVKFDA